MAIVSHRGYRASIRFYSKEEIVKIDESLPNTGSSQEAGFYFDELDSDKSEIGAPVGPFKSEIEATAVYIDFTNKI